MKKLFQLMAAIAIALFVTNCGGKEANTPSAIEKTLYTQLQKGDYQKAAELIIKNLSTEKEMTAEESATLIKSFTEKAKQSTEAKGGVKSFEILEEKISEDGLTATVTTKVVYGDGTDKTETTKYEKKDNDWKLSMGK
ncbi:MAG TPA: DUF4878 domain-containing protein [Paludibacteraceae bacterium]|nr:DUF4878 domain-containing protein [Paludibacteraceae bacterium]HPT43813.1 DUF4878 domain-containing protein [Paludibacteraceae bacterium]